MEILPGDVFQIGAHQFRVTGPLKGDPSRVSGTRMLDGVSCLASYTLQELQGPGAKRISSRKADEEAG